MDNAQQKAAAAPAAPDPKGTEIPRANTVGDDPKPSGTSSVDRADDPRPKDVERERTAAPAPTRVPSIGRIVYVNMAMANGSGMAIRPAIIVRVGPEKVGDPDQGQVELHVFTSAADGRALPPTFEALESPEGEEWKLGTWRWPEWPEQ